MAHKPVQRYIILGLTFLVMLNGTGFFALAWLQTGYHRLFSETEEQEESVSLNMTAQEFSSIAWIGNKDFIWQGKVYDFSSVSRTNGKITVHCFFDHTESNLRDSVSENIEKESDQATAPKPVKAKIPIFPVFPIFSTTTVIPLFSVDTVAYNDLQNPAFEAPVFSLEIPPPELS